MRIALLISGSGTTAEAIIKACTSGRLSGVEPALVIASRADSGGIVRAKEAGIKEEDIVVIDPKTFAGSEEFGQAIIVECKKRNVDFVGQYGWMIKTPENVIREYEGMMTNQHPGPLDPGRADFGGVGMYGMRVHQARLCFVKKTDREYWSEATAQRVAVHFDEGAVVHSKRVEILPDDTAETLAARMLPIEHEVQIETLQMFANKAVKEIIRDTPFVFPGEEGILKVCKKEAVQLYPNG